MNQKKLPNPTAKATHTGLHVKITGIVFWGLALLGLLFISLQLHGLEEELHKRQLATVDHFQLQLERHLNQQNPQSIDSLMHQLESLRREYNLPLIEVQLLGHTRSLGVYEEGLIAYDYKTHADSLLQEGTPLALQVALYLPSVQQQVIDQRKQLLVSMGGAFFLFGVILQWVLQRVLTRPLLQMVNTAQGFSSGETEHRFDAQRNDEFGYLGGFINNALDYLTQQQQELREALTMVRSSEAALYQEKERAEVTLHSIGDAVITTDPTGIIEYLNPQAEKLTGWTLTEVKGRPLEEVLQLVDEVMKNPVANPLRLCLERRAIIDPQEETLLIRRNGDELAISDSAAPIRDRKGDIIGAIMVFHDVGHTRKLARQLSFQAAHDSLTGLYNRHEFEQQLHLALDSAHEDGQEHALCYLDLDQFKVVNDVCGHIAGDELLRQLAAVLSDRVREADVLARLGGDEFGILLNHCDLDKARRVAEDIRRAVRGFRFMYEEHSFDIGASIGLVALNEASASVTEVLSAADVACYAAKDAGRNRIHVYEPGDHEMQRRRGELSWVSQIGKALEENRMKLYFQPIVPMEEGPFKVHFEMLVRMHDDAGNVIPPMAFLPAAERYNLMPTIDRWVVEKMLKTFGPGKAGPVDGIYVANLSGQSLSDDGFLAFVLKCLEQSSLEPNQVCFEITETAAIANLRGATRFIKVLRDHGCRFALDDFGSGLSSFGYLKNLPVDYLKIDGSFVKDMVDDEIDAAMVSAINQIGHVMGIQTIAEFVENGAILKRLRTIGVDYVQGYAVARPIPIEKLIETEHFVPQLEFA